MSKRKRRVFSREFKLSAVQRMIAGGLTAELSREISLRSVSGTRSAEVNQPASREIISFGSFRHFATFNRAFGESAPGEKFDVTATHRHIAMSQLRLLEASAAVTVLEAKSGRQPPPRCLLRCQRKPLPTPS